MRLTLGLRCTMVCSIIQFGMWSRIGHGRDESELASPLFSLQKTLYIRLWEWHITKMSQFYKSWRLRGLYFAILFALILGVFVWQRALLRHLREAQATLAPYLFDGAEGPAPQA